MMIFHGKMLVHQRLAVHIFQMAYDYVDLFDIYSIPIW